MSTFTSPEPSPPPVTATRRKPVKILTHIGGGGDIKAVGGVDPPEQLRQVSTRIGIRARRFPVFTDNETNSLTALASGIYPEVGNTEIGGLRHDICQREPDGVPFTELFQANVNHIFTSKPLIVIDSPT